MTIIETETKICPKCQRKLPLTHFHKNIRCSDGLAWECKDCANKRGRAWRAQHPEQVRRQRREQMKARIAQGKCAFCIQKQLPDLQVCEHHWFVNIAKKNLGSASNAAAQALKDKLSQQDYKCPYTGQVLIPGQNCQIDHIKPQSRFPGLCFALDNLEWVSTAVNSAKRDLIKEEFIELCKQIVAYTQTAQSYTPVENGVTCSPKPEAAPLAVG